MKIFFVAVPLLLIAIFIASLYGALHNQINYAVSNEYFTKFKFIQFGLLSPEISERVRAGVVGVLAHGGWAYF